MAGRILKAAAAGVSLAANTEKTVLGILTGGACCRIVKIAVSTLSQNPTDQAIRINLYNNGTSAGGQGTSTAQTIKITDGGAAYTPLSSAPGNFSAEPTTKTTTGWEEFAGPQAGLVETFSEKAAELIPAGTQYSFSMLALQAQTVNMTVWWEE